MTKKDYIELAKILNEYQNNLNSMSPNFNLHHFLVIVGQKYYFDEMLKELTSFLKRENRRFDIEKFLEAVNN